MKLIVISGNIGSGKSTVLRELQSQGYKCIQEPIDKWQPWLNLFYEEPYKYSLEFQLQILKEFHKVLKSSLNEDIIVMERGMSDSIHIFSKNLYNDKMLNKNQYDMIIDFHKLLNIKDPDLYIYIQTPPESCYERIQKRNRECEKQVPVEYINTIHQLYENYKPINNYHIVDGTLTVGEVANSVLDILNNY